MLILDCKQRLYPFREELEIRVEIRLPRPVNRRGPKDDERKLAGVGEDKFLSPTFASTIRRDRLTGVRLAFPASVLTGTGRGLAGQVDKLLQIGVVLQAGVDEIFCSVSVHLKIGLFLDGLGYTCEMKDTVHAFHRRDQRGLIATISVGILDGKPLEPFEVTRFPDQATDVTPFLNKGLHQMAPDKAGSSSNECFQKVLLNDHQRKDLEFYLFSSNCQGEILFISLGRRRIGASHASLKRRTIHSDQVMPVMLSMSQKVLRIQG
jgi:hypothetical protein